LRGRDEDEDEEAIQSKYEEIRAVCSEFLTIATADAMIILSENFLSPFQKTIPVGTETAVGGYRGMIYIYKHICINICLYMIMKESFANYKAD
jgi:hypothetical protein